MKNAAFIYNPSSGDQSIAQKLDFIIEKFQHRGVLLHPCRLRDINEERILEILGQCKYDFIVISGGDGTLNSIINTLLKNNISIPLGIIPSGTCNDLARCLNIPNDLKQCLDIILGDNLIDVDVCQAGNDKYFLSTCAGGLFVDASFDTHNELKKNFGPFAYYLKAISEIANLKSFHLKITTEKDVIEDDVFLFLISNGKHAAGFQNIIMDADFSDGLMDIVLIKNCSHVDLAGLFFKVLSNESLTDKNVIKIRANHCLIESNNNIILSLDGEKWEPLPQEIRVCHQGLQVFVKEQ